MSGVLGVDVSFVNFTAKQQVDAVVKAHGVPSPLLLEDWTSMMLAFRTKFGKPIPDEKLPAQSYYEAFADKLAINALKAEPLSMVVSAFEEEQQERYKPDPIRQNGLSLDAKLTITVDETSMPVTTTTTVTRHETLFTSCCIATSSSHRVQGQV